MKRIEAKTILEGLGIIALVASLLFVGYQLQQDRELAAAQVIVTHDANQLELIALITENKEIWLKGLSGATLSATDDITFLKHIFVNIRACTSACPCWVSNPGWAWLRNMHLTFINTRDCVKFIPREKCATRSVGSLSAFKAQVYLSDKSMNY